MFLIKKAEMERECPVCGFKASHFDSWSAPESPKEQKDIQCPQCQSHPRHRALWLYLRRNTGFWNMTDKKFLHVAPEPCFIWKFKRAFNDYITADLNAPNVAVKMDITDIPFPDETFDIIMCNHVLEHVKDDKKAMAEIYRAMKKGGMAILLVPMNSFVYATYEDMSITDPGKKISAFWQADHFRAYGLDYFDALKNEGFKVSAMEWHEYLTREEREKFLGKNTHNDIMFHCTK